MEDQMLLRLLQEKPDRGIAEAISQYGGAVKTIVSSFLQGFSEADVEEVISDVFVKLWRFSGQYQPERGGSLKSYVYQIARNAAIDARRKLQKSSELEISEFFRIRGSWWRTRRTARCSTTLCGMWSHC